MRDRPKNIHLVKTTINTEDRDRFMHVWKLKKWKKVFAKYSDIKTNIFFKFDRDVAPEVKIYCKDFYAWLKETFEFPVKVVVYIRASEHIKAMDGELVSATIWEPVIGTGYPYIRVATGDYYELKEERGEYNALLTILCSIAHELTHYFQWLNNLELTPCGEERQAKRYAIMVIEEYLDMKN